MIGKDLVEPHGEELRSAGRLETLSGEVVKVLALDQRQRIAETEGHSHRGQGMVVSGRIANKHSTGAPVCDARPQLIGRDLELPRPQRFDERRPQCFRQHTGIRVRQEANPVPGCPAVQWDINDDPDTMLSQTVYEHWTRSTAQHMSIPLQR